MLRMFRCSELLVHDNSKAKLGYNCNMQITLMIIRTFQRENRKAAKRSADASRSRPSTTTQVRPRHSLQPRAIQGMVEVGWGQMEERSDSVSGSQGRNGLWVSDRAFKIWSKKKKPSYLSFKKRDSRFWFSEIQHCNRMTQWAQVDIPLGLAPDI